MTEEPYRWLEAVGNRREYVENQLKGGSPVFAFSLAEGVLLIGVGTGQSKVFEIFDRQAMAGLGHPADLERIRQGIIDAAHLEGFVRASADVTLRRLVSFGLGPQLKTAFEQIFAPPFLVRLLLAEVGDSPTQDMLVKVDFDGSFTFQSGGHIVMAADNASAAEAEAWVGTRLTAKSGVAEAATLALESWRRMVAGESLDDTAPDAKALQGALAGRVIEAALLRRTVVPIARYKPLSRADIGLITPPPS